MISNNIMISQVTWLRYVGYGEKIQTQTITNKNSCLPKLVIKSCLVIPIPVSVMDRIWFSLSHLIRIDISDVVSKTDLSVSDINLKKITSLNKFWHVFEPIWSPLDQYKQNNYWKILTSLNKFGPVFESIQTVLDKFGQS